MEQKMEEVWKPVVGYETHYEASSSGHIRRIATGRILRNAISPDGYCYVSLTVNGKSKVMTAHKVVATTFLGPRPDGCTVNHKDLNKENNAISNLEYLSQRDNVRHAARAGRIRETRARGERHGTHVKPESLRRGSDSPAAKLTEASVLEIRERWSNRKTDKVTKCSLALDYGVSDALIGLIVRRMVWAHI